MLWYLSSLSPGACKSLSVDGIQNFDPGLSVDIGELQSNTQTHQQKSEQQSGPPCLPLERLQSTW